MKKPKLSGKMLNDKGIPGTGLRWCEECGTRCRVGRADLWRKAGKTCPACGSRRLLEEPPEGHPDAQKK